MITHRTLRSDEAARAVAAGGPLAEMPPDLLADTSIAVVEVEGEIVAYWCAWYALHIEPLWVREDQRKHPAVIKGIVDEIHAIMDATPARSAFCLIDPADEATVLPYAQRLGFHAAPGNLYYLLLDPLAGPVEV